MVAFLKDPSGPPLWEENPEAKDVVHIETEKVSKQWKTAAGFQEGETNSELHFSFTSFPAWTGSYK